MKLTDSYNLEVLYPKISKQWHPRKNGNLKPAGVTPGSRKKAWWLCQKGHEWESTILRRVLRKGCPYCTARMVSPDKNLLFLHPGIAKQWHLKKNGVLTPEKVTGVSSKSVWWRCDKGHEWRAVIANRTRGDGCPFCGRKRVSDEYNLQIMNPGLAKQWHPTKNGDLTPDRVTPDSYIKVWWTCNKDHEWISSILSRARGGTCPFCGRKRASDEYNLQLMNPELAKQWHPTENGDLKPDEVTPGSGKKVWWLCEKGHKWRKEVWYRNRFARIGCPYCQGRKYTLDEYNLQLINPSLAKQWHPTENGGLKPDKVKPSFNMKVWWLCEEGHKWREKIGYRNRHAGAGCPYCRSRVASPEYNLQVTNPLLAKQWHPTKNGELTPDKITGASLKKVWWLCEKGHQWKAYVSQRINNNDLDCPVCREILTGKMKA